MKEVLSESEIIRFYRDAKNKEKQLDKLVDLTGMNRKALIEYLQVRGEALDRSPDERRKTAITDDTWRKVIEMKIAGYNNRQVANTTGITEHMATLWHKEAARLGIKVPKAVQPGFQLSEQKIREEQERRKEREKNDV